MPNSFEEALLETNVEEPSTSSSFTDEALVINTKTRKIQIPPGFFLGVYNDKDVFSVPFVVERYFNEIDLSEFTIRINYINASGYGNVYEVVDPVVTEDMVSFEWVLGRGVLAKEGYVNFSVCMVKAGNDGTVEQEFNTTIATSNVLTGLEVDSTDNPEVYSVFATMRELATEAAASAEAVSDTQTEIEEYVENIEAQLRSFVGAPRVASSYEDMVNVDHIYVYVGNEEGYTYGDWYYYDGADWVSGGAYYSSVPSNISSFTNDVGYLTLATLPIYDGEVE